MPYFSPLLLTPSGEGERAFRLAASLAYKSAVPDVGTVTVPAGYVTDLASIPWWARVCINPAGPHAAAAVVLAADGAGSPNMAKPEGRRCP